MKSVRCIHDDYVPNYLFFKYIVLCRNGNIVLMVLFNDSIHLAMPVNMLRNYREKDKP